MIRFLRWVPLAVGLLLAVFVILLLNYYLPSSRKVHITGTEVKRMDVQEAGKTRDVRFIYAQDADTGKSLAYRNEDTRWGFPFYFKFDSGDVAAEAANILENDPKATVLVTSYGYRMRYFDEYPNVVSLRVVAPEHSIIPVFNIIFWTLFVVAVVVAALWVRRTRKRFRNWRAKRNG